VCAVLFPNSSTNANADIFEKKIAAPLQMVMRLLDNTQMSQRNAIPMRSANMMYCFYLKANWSSTASFELSYSHIHVMAQCTGLLHYQLASRH
jgi:hypothetical protein